MNIEKYLSDKRLIGTLDKYTTPKTESKEIPAGTALVEIAKNLQTGKMVIPVLGMQGMGKSTLINSVLGKNILPNDADETTCVPVEVCYGEKEYAEVFFKNGGQPIIVHTREELNAYVDNNENPANEKNVLKIVLYEKLDLLKGGMTIVDLPGVGSLTVQNADTTNTYIRNLCTAIFVIPTTPTIRKQEVLFIKSVWSQFPTAIFVQNHWDENKRELEESVEYNTLVLKRIAGELNTGFNEKIIVVNAYDALTGALDNDERLVERSGLPSLVLELVSFSEKWKTRMNNELMKRVFYEVLNVQNIIKRIIHEWEAEEEQIRQERIAEAERYKEQTREISRRIREIEDYLDDKESEIRILAEEKSKECASNIRVETFKLIDQGIVDGEQLSQAFKDFQEQYIPDTLNDVFDVFYIVKLELDEMFEKLNEIVIEKNMKSETKMHSIDDDFKYEKMFPTMGAIAGGIIFGLLFVSLSNPITLIPAALVSIVCGIIGSALKKNKLKKRAKEAKDSYSPVIDELQNKIKESIISQFSDIRNNISNALKEIKSARKEKLAELENSIYNFEKPDRTDLTNDLDYLEKTAKEIESYV